MMYRPMDVCHKDIGRYQKSTLRFRKAAQEVSRLQALGEVAFVSLIDGYCQFSNHELTQHAKIDFDHLEGLTLYSIPAVGNGGSIVRDG